jgi:hypothetical protein
MVWIHQPFKTGVCMPQTQHKLYFQHSTFLYISMYAKNFQNLEKWMSCAFPISHGPKSVRAQDPNHRINSTRPSTCTRVTVGQVTGFNVTWDLDLTYMHWSWTPMLFQYKFYKIVVKNWISWQSSILFSKIFWQGKSFTCRAHLMTVTV